MGSTGSPEDFLKTLNHGKIPTVTEFTNRLLQGGATGYVAFLKMLFWASALTVTAGIFLMLIGLLTNSNNIKRWASGTIIIPFALFGLAVMVPMILAWIKHYTTTF